MNQDRRYFNIDINTESYVENSPNQNISFDLAFLYGTPVLCEEFCLTENNQMMEQNDYPNFDNNLNFNKGLTENAIEDLEKDKFFKKIFYRTVFKS